VEVSLRLNGCTLHSTPIESRYEEYLSCDHADVCLDKIARLEWNGWVAERRNAG
jgi:hypothetical protein